MTGELCNACRKPFDEVHPLDFMNDWICADVNSDFEIAPNFAVGELRPMSSYYGLNYRPCRQNHTWREHVQQSYRNRGQSWFNPHYRVPAEDSVRKTE